MLRHIAHSFSLVLLCLTAGCGPDPETELVNRFVRKAKVTLKSDILDSYVGTYQLPTGVLFHVHRDGDRLMAGANPYELLPQTSRQFASNRHGGQINFEIDSVTLETNLVFGTGDSAYKAARVNPNEAVDPCRMIDVGGHRLRMLMLGPKGPTVVIENGFGSSIEGSAALQLKISRFTQVVTYDHAGTGGSEPGPNPRHAQQVARELHRALTTAGMDPPWIFVGASIGGHYIRVFASLYPDDVAGVVLLDPSPDWEDMAQWYRDNNPSQLGRFEQGQRLTDKAFKLWVQHMEPGRRAEVESIPVTLAQAHAARALPEVPVVQITGTLGSDTKTGIHDKVLIYDQWLKEHIPHARHVLAKKSGHNIVAAEPRLVMDEIRKVVAQVRARRQSQNHSRE